MNELKLFETFLQYGDLKNAKVIYVGLEEGLGRRTLDEAIKARKLLLNNNEFKEHIAYVNDTNANDGWYVKNNLYLDKAYDKLDHTSKNEEKPNKPDQTMRYQARMNWLLKKGNRTDNYENIAMENFSKISYIHNPESGSAMIDFYPLPKIGTSNWEKKHKEISGFESIAKYHKHYKSLNKSNNRYQILKGIYDRFPMNISIVYAGISQRKFRLKEFYKSIGFDFKLSFTNVVNNKYREFIKPSNEVPCVFQFGDRVINGTKQIVILTPFWGQGQIGANDIDVIASWLP